MPVHPVMTRATALCALALACVLGAEGTAAAQAVSAPKGAPPPAPAPAPTASPQAPPALEAQRTTATFGDWILRCLRPEHAAPSCELAYIFMSDRGAPFAQLAIGHAPGEPMRATLQVPTNVRLAAQPRLIGTERDATPIELSWQRCLPAGCFADAPLTDDQLRKLRASHENGHVVFQDASGREATLALVHRGLAQGLDALAREEQSTPR